MPRALIAGGSLAGLAAANLLARRGFDVDVFERTETSLEGRGAGIVTHPELLDGLEACGARVDQTVGVYVPGRVTYARDGSVVGTRDAPQILTSWQRLYWLLREPLPDARYHLGRRLERVEQTTGSVIAHFSDGSRETGDLLVGADGIRSQVRAQLLPSAVPQYAGYVAWRGLTAEASLSDAAREALFCKFAFCLPESEQMLGYPVAGPRNSVAPGTRAFNFVWYRPVDERETLPRMLTDASGRRHDAGIPPHLIDRKWIDAMYADADRLLSPQFAEVVRKADQPFFQPIFDLVSPRLAFGRVALIGDAAFVARPHVGMGVAKAVSDALALADSVSAAWSDGRGIEAGLRDYEALRRPSGVAVVDRARQLGAYMQAQLSTPEQRAAAARYRTPESVMAETALHADYWTNPERHRLPAWAGLA